MLLKDFKDPKEIIREALRNSWDAGASEVSIKFLLIHDSQPAESDPISLDTELA